MLDEAVEIIRLLWEGDEINYWGEFYTVENARIYTLPDTLPPIYIAASGPQSASLAGEIGDGFISTKADAKLVEAFNEAGGDGKPRYGKIAFCWAESKEKALDTVHEWWPTAAIPGSLHADLPTPAHFEEAASLVKKEDLQSVPLGPDPEPFLESIQSMIDAGFDHVYLHQIGPDQEGFFRFYEHELRPKLQR
jgi:G6PDH family F420-dependent oxidoreductase